MHLDPVVLHKTVFFWLIILFLWKILSWLIQVIIYYSQCVQDLGKSLVSTDTLIDWSVPMKYCVVFLADSDLSGLLIKSFLETDLLYHHIEEYLRENELSCFQIEDCPLTVICIKINEWTVFSLIQVCEIEWFLFTLTVIFIYYPL